MNLQKKSLFMLAALFVASSSLQANSSGAVAAARAASAVAHAANMQSGVEPSQDLSDAVVATRAHVRAVGKLYQMPSVTDAQKYTRQTGEIFAKYLTPVISSNQELKELLPMHKWVAETIGVDAHRKIATASNAIEAVQVAHKAAKAVDLLASSALHTSMAETATNQSVQRVNAEAAEAQNEALESVQKCLMINPVMHRHYGSRS